MPVEESPSRVAGHQGNCYNKPAALVFEVADADLRNLLAKGGQVSPALAQDISGQTCEALALLALATCFLY